MAAVTRLGLYGGPRPAYVGFTPAPDAKIVLSGDITSADEQHIRSGGRKILLTITDGDTWVSGAAFTNVRQAIIDGLDSDGVEALGWNNEVRDKEVVGAVVRTSSTVVTITLSASSAYDITSTETITATIPLAALSSAPEDPVIAVPTFTISLFTLACTLSGSIIGASEDDIRAGGKEIILTLTGDDTFVAEPGFSFGPARQQIIDGLVSDGVELTGWNNEVRDKEVVGAVVRTSPTVVTITLTAAPAYDVTSLETITSTIPAIALTRSTQTCDVTPTFSLGPVAARKKGGIGGKYYRKRRRVMIEGVIHTVRDRAEERALLALYLEQQRAQLETAEPMHVPAIQAKIRRAEKRTDKAVAVELAEAEANQERLRTLADEDEEILILLLH